jgi:dTDP-L-rhamnose 4-epimerase
MADLRTARRTAGQAPRVFQDGARRRDFVSVHDVAAANVLALRHPEPAAFRAYNVASGAVRAVGEMATELAAACGGRRRWSPGGTGWAMSGMSPAIRAGLARSWASWPGCRSPTGVREFATAALRGR